MVMLSLDGNQQAWDSLYNHSNQIVVGFTKKYLFNFKTGVLSCEDIVSEAYYRAFARLSTFQGRSRFSSWVCGIVKRIVWTENAKCCRRERIYRQSIVPSASLYSRDPCDIFIELELNTSLWKAFESLHPVESYILENYVVNEQTFRELSRATHLPSREVEARYHNALSKYSKNFHIIHHRK